MVAPAHKIVNLLDYPFAEWNIVTHKLTDIIKGFLVTDCLHVILERLLVNGQTPENKVSFTQGQRIAFNSIGVVGVFNGELFIQAFQFAFG